jgi:hypothetical protein
LIQTCKSQLWQADEVAVRTGICYFPVKVIQFNSV